MIKAITQNIFQLSFSVFSSNVYLLKKEKTLIDTGSRQSKAELLNDLEKLHVRPNDVKIVLLTHCHYDHVGNVLLFKKAKIYASETEIASIEDKELKKLLIPLSKFKSSYLKVITTPGHTQGSVCFFIPKEKILFSGDTLFDSNFVAIGRTDLQESVLEKMQESLEKLKKLNFKILCPGH